MLCQFCAAWPQPDRRDEGVWHLLWRGRFGPWSVPHLVWRFACREVEFRRLSPRDQGVSCRFLLPWANSLANRLGLPILTPGCTLAGPVHRPWRGSERSRGFEPLG